MRKTHPMPTPSQRRWQFSKRAAYILGLLLFVPLCRPIASATEVYAFLGFDYTSASGIYTTNDYVSGDFTTSSLLPPNMYTDITPLTYAFGDGYFEWTSDNSTASRFQVLTDPYGTILGANISIVGTVSLPYQYTTLWWSGQILIDAFSGELAIASLGGYPLGLANSYGTGGGKWGPNFDPPDTPEPASAVLTSAALLAFAFLARKRIAQGIRLSPQMHR